MTPSDAHSIAPFSSTSAGGAQWIGDGKPTPIRDEDFYADDPAPMFRRSFVLNKPITRASLAISAAGYYEASINGQRVGNLRLDPGWTNYAKRILYSTYDVTDLVHRRENTIGVTLGNGWYNPLPLRLWGARNLRDELPTGRPTFLAQLQIEYTDGTVEALASDTTWRWHEGPMIRNNIYLGEVYDARLERPGWDAPGFDDARWHAASLATPPGGVLVPQLQPPIRTTETITPIAITEAAAGTTIVDMGQNFAGGIRLRINAPTGTEIVMRYGELLHEDGSLNPMTSVCGQIKGLRENGVPKGGPGSPEIAWQEDRYIAKGERDEAYSQTFTWHAFRYVEISGLPKAPSLDDITGLRQHSDVQTVGTFECSNDLFNRIQQITQRTFLSNIFSVQSDCPHRERFGYGGDLTVTSEAFIANYDMAQFYAKAVRDWGDAAHADGMLTDTAPSVGMQYCGLGWAMAHPILLSLLYRYYGHTALIMEQYDCAARWLTRVRELYPDHIIEKGLSDHEALESGTPPAMVTPLYYQCACTMAKLADILGRAVDAEDYRQLAGQIEQAYTTAFLQPGTGIYEPGTQAAQAFALYSGLVSDGEKTAALAALADDIVNKHEGHITTGIFGTKYILDVLSENGMADIAYDMVDKRDFPSWGHMIEQGATTLWETWAFSDNTYSHNHPMFGSVSEWFYKHVAGIQIDADAEGSDKVTIHPKLTHKLAWAKASYRSVHGDIACHWYWETEALNLDITIPAGVTATVILPAAAAESVTINSVPASRAKGITLLHASAGNSVYHARPGTHAFRVTPSNSSAC